MVSPTGVPLPPKFDGDKSWCNDPGKPGVGEILLEPILSALRSIASVGPLSEPGSDGSGCGCSCSVRISEPVDKFHIIFKTVENWSGRRGN
jgi:hypothetical protein